MVVLKYLDKDQTVIRSEFYSSKAKALSLIDLFEKDEMYKSMIPPNCEYISIESEKEKTAYWLDRRENIIVFREWSIG